MSTSGDINDQPIEVFNRVKQHYERFSIRAAFAGVFIALGVIALALLISSQIKGAGISGFISEISTAIFLGASTGHYLGMALRKEGDRMTSFLLGGSGTLSLALIWGIVGFTLRGAVLVTFALGIFLMHNSGLVANHENIEGYVRQFSEKTSAVVLSLIALWKYVGPLGMEILGALGISP